MLPASDVLTICFAHAAYRLLDQFSARATGIGAVEVRTPSALAEALPDTDVLVVSGLWRNDLLDHAPKLKFIQSIGAGTDQFDRAALAAKNIRLASASGVNANAVSEHAMALILALARRLPEARDNQARKFWRGMIGDPAGREDELGGKTLLIVGIGRIGGRLARLARAFGMTVIGVRRDVDAGANGADAVYGLDALHTLLPEADYVALTCPLTPDTERLIGAAALARMKPSSMLINCARGRVVDEAALIGSLRTGAIAGAALDVTEDEPLGEGSPLWTMPNVLLTPHTAGETRAYEANVLDIMQDNLGRLWRGEIELRNGIV